MFYIVPQTQKNMDIAWRLMVNWCFFQTSQQLMLSRVTKAPLTSTWTTICWPYSLRWWAPSYIPAWPDPLSTCTRHPPLCLSALTSLIGFGWGAHHNGSTEAQPRFVEAAGSRPGSDFLVPDEFRLWKACRQIETTGLELSFHCFIIPDLTRRCNWSDHRGK